MSQQRRPFSHPYLRDLRGWRDMFVRPTPETLERFLAYRDPARLYADLQEAIRRNRVVNYIATGPTPASKMYDPDALRTIYDMDLIAQGWGDNWKTIHEYSDRGGRVFDDGFLVAGNVALMHAYVELNENNKHMWIEQITLIDPVNFKPPTEEPDTGFLVYSFEHGVLLNALPSTRSRWICRRVVIKPAGWGIENTPDDYRHPEYTALSEEDQQDIARDQDFLFAMCGALTSEPQLAEATPHADFVAMNAERARSKLPAVPPVMRVLDIGIKVSSEHESTGRQTPTHFRRGTMRPR